MALGQDLSYSIAENLFLQISSIITEVKTPYITFQSRNELKMDQGWTIGRVVHEDSSKAGLGDNFF